MKMSPLGDVSIIVPIAPGDVGWQSLLPDLGPVSEAAELILSGVGPPPADLDEVVGRSRLRLPVCWVDGAAGRARQLNAGAGRADRRFLWFLHADSRIDPSGLSALQCSLAAAPEALHYFELAFLDDGPSLMRLNALGARIRSHLLKIPFGDQGFCLDRRLFEQLGRFDERAAYGEDHLLVWAARRQRVPLRWTGARLRTSARKYRERGWLPTTARHLLLTARQALPQAGHLWKERLWQRLRPAERSRSS